MEFMHRDIHKLSSPLLVVRNSTRHLRPECFTMTKDLEVAKFMDNDVVDEMFRKKKNTVIEVEILFC